MHSMECEVRNNPPVSGVTGSLTGQIRGLAKRIKGHGNIGLASMIRPLL
ncbi:hypothetical protein [Paenibacillus sp. IHBB 10380]|nr:hypothetical protein [Paenibacillus sp. IHBB 10380]